MLALRGATRPLVSCYSPARLGGAPPPEGAVPPTIPPVARVCAPLLAGHVAGWAHDVHARRQAPPQGGAHLRLSTPQHLHRPRMRRLACWRGMISRVCADLRRLCRRRRAQAGGQAHRVCACHPRLVVQQLQRQPGRAGTGTDKAGGSQGCCPYETRWKNISVATGPTTHRARTRARPPGAPPGRGPPAGWRAPAAVPRPAARPRGRRRAGLPRRLRRVQNSPACSGRTGAPPPAGRRRWGCRPHP